ncbi:MAG TPA: hypothetical protein VFT67_14635 [Jatrophihabitantaceae bacterium]|nr:hypothetical protein [Jatrophihabitantaceae bacterium]
MTTESAGSARARLELARDLAREVRREQRAAWFPLLVFGVITLIAIPVTRAGHAAGLVCRGNLAPGEHGVRVCVAHNSAAFVYWPVALIAAYVLIAFFYLRLARARGVGTRVRPYVVVGLVLACVTIAASIWASHRVLSGGYDFAGWHLQGPDLYRLIAPACAIGLALLVLAAVDRSVVLGAVALVFLVIAIGRPDFGWSIRQTSRWAFAPHLVIEAAVLLLASAGFALVQLQHRRARRRPV